ncbi:MULTISPECIES: hypothetical protein [Methylobacterium]|uniref:hypothetical protein n=1 Tax=Methylobacterium TaxID=407 RepID=UPI0013ED27C2|nr:hypothetical protein [Methylobacterium sp. DB0501]NGM36221.1 hypothetical protein [Methylobacterium sp. DB0501]
MRAHVIAHRIGMTISSLIWIFIFCGYAIYDVNLIQAVGLYIVMLASIMGFAVYALCRAIGWIIAGFSSA